MKKLFLFIFPLFAAFLALVVVNEYSRKHLGKTHNSLNGYATMNSALAIPEACTWNCYKNTSFCKKNHVKVLNNYFNFFDPLYFGMIKALKMSGNYGVANVIFLVIIWPLLLAYLFARSIAIQSKIRSLKKVI